MMNTEKYKGVHKPRSKNLLGFCVSVWGFFFLDLKEKNI